MARVVVTAVMIVLLAVLVAFNLKFTTSVSLYGVQYDGVPVMVVALLSFALGVVYSLVLYVGRYLHQRSRRRLDERNLDKAPRGQEGAVRDPHASPAAEPSDVPPPEAPNEQAVDPPRGPRLRLFRKPPGRG